MSCYCDTSFFIRQLIPGSRRAETLQLSAAIAARSGAIPLSEFTRLETIQALRFEGWLHRNDRTKGLPASKVETAINLFLAQCGSNFQIVSTSWGDVFARAEELTRGTPEKGWRTLDVIHVASALVIGATEFYSFDREQNELAASERLNTPVILRNPI